MPSTDRRADASHLDVTRDVRASDVERGRVVDALSRHAVEGRLTVEELDARIDVAHGALTRGELAALTADLPAVEGDEDTGHASRRARPGHAPLAAFVAVNLVLVAVWAIGGGGYFWPVWSILGWGACLTKASIHGQGMLCGRGHSAARLSRSTRT